jgi:single-strand DNA-binding protein
MSGANLVILIGRLGKNPEIKHLTSGTAISSFSLATSESWKDKNTGEKTEKTEWHNCKAFGRLAEVCSEYLTKGSQIYVEGKLETSSWDKDGTKHYRTEIVLNKMQMLGNHSWKEPSGVKQQAPINSNDIPF